MGDSTTRSLHLGLVGLMKDLQRTGRTVKVHTADGNSVEGSIVKSHISEDGLVTVDRGGQLFYVVTAQITRIDEMGDSRMVAFG